MTLRAGSRRGGRWHRARRHQGRGRVLCRSRYNGCHKRAHSGSWRKTGLLTTGGFRDLLEIGRQKRPDLYDLRADKPELLVERHLRFGIEERVLATGTVETPLDETALREAVRALKADGVKAVAVNFLYSFMHAEHEKIAARILEDEFPEAFHSLSHRIAPEFREFERLSTTVVNAYLGPVMQGYVKSLSGKLTDLGITVAPPSSPSRMAALSALILLPKCRYARFCPVPRPVLSLPVRLVA